MPGRRIETDADFRELLEKAETVAVLGLSPKPHRASHGVAAYLQEAGYRIVPVHPAGGEILGEKVYASAAEIPAEVKIDLVDVFRRPDSLPELVPEILRLAPRWVWLQLGVTHPEAEAALLAGGVDLVVDRCLKIEHMRLMRR